jgi:hypothetical protein
VTRRNLYSLMVSTPSSAAGASSRRWLLLRERGPEFLGWLTLGALLLTGLPLFLCMPLTNDVTLYDQAARNVLHGGTHYREVFDTNLPGMVWLHAAVRGLLGWSDQALRLVDFLVVSAIVWLLVRWLRPLGRGRAERVWAGVLLLTFYLSTSEWVHCQRDVWMLLPALGGMWLRRRQLAELTGPDPSSLRLALGAVAEGLCWGVAFWIKPFVAVPALACWLTSLLLVRGSGRGGLVLVDAVCLFAGGLLIGGAGVLWLVASGTWPYFWDVFTTWNTSYFTHGALFSLARLRYFLWTCLPPWSVLHLVSVPLTLIALLRALVGGAEERASEPGRREALLAAVYLGWLLQVIFFQKNFDYVQAPLLLLAGAVVAGHTRLLRRSLLAWVALLVFVVCALVWSPLFRGDRLALWGRCWREGGTVEMHERLALTYSNYPQIFEELASVAGYLRSRGVGDGELTCWNTTPHVLYLDLNVAPAFPYMQVDTVLLFFPQKEELLRRQLAASGQRFVVSDLQSPRLMGGSEAAHAEQPGQPLALPPGFPPEWKDCFPWSEPIAFRSGRYLVQEVTGPPGPLLPKGPGR